MNEQRSFPRVSATHLACFAEPGSDWWRLGRTIDLSLRGLALAVGEAAPVGAAVNVTLSLHDHVVEVAGTVVRADRCAPAGYEVCVALHNPSRAYWRLLALTFADQAPAGQAGR